MYKYDILRQAQHAETLAVASQAVVYTNHFSMPLHQENPTFSFEYKATSGGNVALKFELEQSNYAPATAGAADDWWCKPDDCLEFNDNLTDELLHIKAYPPAPTLFGRFKITGLALNDASTVISHLVLTSVR